MMFYNFFQETSIGGLCYIRKEKSKFLQGFWLFMFLVGLGATARSVYATLQHFLSSPTSTEYKIISQTMMRLPHIVICTSNRFNGSMIRKLNMSAELVSALNQGYDANLAVANPLSQETLEEDFVGVLEKTEQEYIDLKEKLGIKHYAELVDMLYSKCEDIILRCKTIAGYPVPCCESAEVFEEVWGSCVFLPKYSQYGTVSDNIVFTLKFPNVTELNPTWNQLLVDDFIISLSEGSFMDTGVEYSAVQRGSYTTLSLKKVSFQAVNNPPDYVCKNVKPDSQYKRLDCMIRCYERAKAAVKNHQQVPCQVMVVGRKIGSRDPDHPICDPWTFLNLTLGGMPNENQIATPQEVSYCTQNCPPPCKQTSYEVSYRTFSKLSRLKIDKLMKDKKRADDLAENHAVLVVGLEKLEEKKVRQQFSFTLEMLVGQIGGFLGLFLGGSLISLVHVLVYMMHTKLCRQKPENLSEDAPPL